jgi:hypothetical protein
MKLIQVRIKSLSSFINQEHRRLIYLISQIPTGRRCVLVSTLDYPARRHVIFAVQKMLN